MIERKERLLLRGTEARGYEKIRDSVYNVFLLNL
jgi:hypothetical protein